MKMFLSRRLAVVVIISVLPNSGVGDWSDSGVGDWSNSGVGDWSDSGVGDWSNSGAGDWYPSTWFTTVYSNDSNYCNHSQTDLVCKPGVNDYRYLKFVEEPDSVVYENADISEFHEIDATIPQRWKKVYIHDVYGKVNLTVTKTMSDIRVYKTYGTQIYFSNDADNIDLVVSLKRASVELRYSRKGDDNVGQYDSMKSLDVSGGIGYVDKEISASDCIRVANGTIWASRDELPLYLVAREINITSSNLYFFNRARANLITIDKCTVILGDTTQINISSKPYIKAGELLVTNSDFDFQPWFVKAPQTQHGQNVYHAHYELNDIDDTDDTKAVLKLKVGSFISEENTFHCGCSMKGVTGLGEIGDVNYCRVDDDSKVTINHYISQLNNHTSSVYEKCNL